MEQKKYKQINTKTPEIQEMILSYQIGGVAYELSQRLEISPALALDLFYRSKTCAQLHDKRTGLYLMSNGYIADTIYDKAERVLSRSFISEIPCPLHILKGQKHLAHGNTLVISAPAIVKWRCSMVKFI